MPPIAHQKAAETHKIPAQHRYNTRGRCLQGQELMSNHVATIYTPPYKPIKPTPLVRPEEDYWKYINQLTGKLILQPGRSYAVIFHETLELGYETYASCPTIKTS